MTHHQPELECEIIWDQETKTRFRAHGYLVKEIIIVGIEHQEKKDSTWFVSRYHSKFSVPYVIGGFATTDDAMVYAEEYIRGLRTWNG